MSWTVEKKAGKCLRVGKKEPRMALTSFLPGFLSEAG